MRRVLLIDDDTALLTWLETAFIDAGYESHCATDGASALDIARQCPLDAALIDLRLPDTSGLNLLPSLTNQAILCVVMTGFANCRSAVDAMRCGAFDYIEKPFVADDVIDLLERAISYSPMIGEEGSRHCESIQCLLQHVQKHFPLHR